VQVGVASTDGAIAKTVPIVGRVVTELLKREEDGP
jgi:hypothetical protein